MKCFWHYSKVGSLKVQNQAHIFIYISIKELVWHGFSILEVQLKTTRPIPTNMLLGRFNFFFFTFWKMAKRWLSRAAVFAVHHQRLTSAGPRWAAVFLLRVRTLFVLARCTEAICRCVSECKTRAPCIVMCHLSKPPGPLPLRSSCNVTRPAPLGHVHARAHQRQNHQGVQFCSN